MPEAAINENYISEDKFEVELEKVRSQEKRKTYKLFIIVLAPIILIFLAAAILFNIRINLGFLGFNIEIEKMASKISSQEIIIDEQKEENQLQTDIIETQSYVLELLYFNNLSNVNEIAYSIEPEENENGEIEYTISYDKDYNDLIEKSLFILNESLDKLNTFKIKEQ